MRKATRFRAPRGSPAASARAAARFATKDTPDSNPRFFLFADLPSLKRAEDVLRMPWKTAHPRKTAVLDLRRREPLGA